MKKSITRRNFVLNSGKAGLAVPFLSYGLVSCSAKSKKESSADSTTKKNLRILILGGTSFLGPHQISYALSKGHSVTTFTRGKTKPTVHAELFKDVEQLTGDRETNLTAIEDGQWDLVIDNSGHKVEWTKKTADLLKDRADQYMYTSSTGVYYPYLGKNIDEETQVVLAVPEGIQGEENKLEYGYGVMKANSEIETIKAFGKDRSIIVRPTYMIGPADKSDRFIYWPIRLSRGGEIMVPGKIDDPVQYIDVRDVAEWMIRLAEQKKASTYNAVGPKSPESIHEFAVKASEAFDVESTLIAIDDYQFLKDNGVPYLVPWILPEGNNFGSARVDNKKAIDAGLTLRDLKESVKDTHDWWYSDALTDERRQKFEGRPNSLLIREKSILERWKNKLGR